MSNNGKSIDFGALLKGARNIGDELQGRQLSEAELGYVLKTPATELLGETVDLSDIPNLPTDALSTAELSTEDLELLEAEGDEMALEDIWKKLSIHEDLIMIIDKSDEPRLRKGLSAMKSKETAKLRSAGLPIEPVNLEFVVHKAVEGMPPNVVKLQVFLKKRAVVRLHKIIIPNGGL